MLDETSLVVDGFKNFGRSFVVNPGTGAGIDVEGDAKFFKRFLDHFVVLVNDRLGSCSLLFCLDRDRDTVFIGASDEENILPLQSEVTGINIGRYVYSGQMPDVDRAICIGQSGGDQGSLKFAHLLVDLFLCADSHSWGRTKRKEVRHNNPSLRPEK